MQGPLIFVVVGFLIVVALVLYARWHQSHGKCANCGAPSQFGYSPEAESRAKDIVKLCFACLAAKLRDDYERFGSRALIIQPTTEFPCYVFQENSNWAESQLAKEVSEFLPGPGEACNRCESKAHYSWVTSNGLNATNFERVLSDGLQQTLLRWGNAGPIPLCAGCCVESITKAIADRGLRFHEVCSPCGGDGFVLPMGY